MPISEFQFQELLRRTNRGVPVPTPAETVRLEGDLHDSIIDFCKARGWLYFHGSMAHRTYRTEGEPDFHIWADGGRKFAFECKSRSGKLSTKQLGVIAHAKHLGHIVHTIGSMKEFENVVL